MQHPPSKRAVGLAAAVAVLVPLVAMLIGGVMGGDGSSAEESAADPGEEAIVFEPGPESGGGGFRETTLADLARRDEVVVTARATRTEQVDGGEAPSYTRRTFIRGETLAGRIGRRFVVRFFGGSVRTPDAVIPPDPEDPQFEPGKSYLLVLARPPAGGDLTIVGPAAGRYEVGRSGLEPVGSGPAQSALGGLTPQQAAGRIARADAGG